MDASNRTSRLWNASESPPNPSRCSVAIGDEQLTPFERSLIQKVRSANAQIDKHLTKLKEVDSMIDLEKKISGFGTAGTRGMEAIEILKAMNAQSGTFQQNDLTIVVYQDSTEREIMYQYELKRCHQRSVL